MKTLSIGILAHIDAGKTSTTERLLFDTGMIDELGSVDAGTTRTDFMDQERRRGITIQAAVTAFTISDVQVNLVDTPGHPDFIAEIERVLDVLDGAILVISSVEGIQAQTRVLYRALKRMAIPCLIFANKIDRPGARYASLLEEIRTRLTPTIMPLGSCTNIGEANADFHPFDRFLDSVRQALIETLADNDEEILTRFVEHGPNFDDNVMRQSLVDQTRRGLVHPVLFGSAITGAGIGYLIQAIPEFLPAMEYPTEGKPRGTIFKIERGRSGEKICFAKIVSGTLRLRDRVQVGGVDERVTAIQVFENGTTIATDQVKAGRITKLWGLSDARIGDSIGESGSNASEGRFSPPMLETAVRARDPKARGQLYAALSQLAEQDPYISLRLDENTGVLHVSLYGEVQREVIEEKLLSEYRIEVDFSETTTIQIERLIGVGKALDEAPDPFVATIGLTVEPRPADAGNVFELAVEQGLVPAAFFNAVEDSVMETLRQGLYGWQVIDCKVTMTKTIRYRDWAQSTAADHRKLAPLVVMDALKRAGTRVHEPIQTFHLECPSDSLGRLIVELVKLRAVPSDPIVRGPVCLLEGTIPAAKVRALQLILPGLTRGEGFLDTVFSHYDPVIGDYPTRPRTDKNPLNRKDYLRLTQ
jgi:ribosomal protection tetracycline resistance protein